MSERRRDKRFRLTEPIHGALRVFLDAIVQPNGTDEWIAISRSAAVAGETLMLDVATGETDATITRERFAVCVIDSRPIIVDGAIRYRIRLRGGDVAPVLFEQQIRRG